MVKDFIAITTSLGLVFIKRSTILYCLSAGSYATIHLADGRKLMVSKNLKEVSNILDDKYFVRIHNSHLINMEHACSFINSGHNCVQMSNGEELAVSRNRKKEFLALFVRL